MKMRISKLDSALAKRDSLKTLIADLRSELRDVEREIRFLETEPSTKLNQDFFWTLIVPKLADAGSRGLTSAEIRSALDKQGLPIDAGKFRVFLSRSRSRGWLEFTKNIGELPRWRLAPNIEKLQTK